VGTLQLNSKTTIHYERIQDHLTGPVLIFLHEGLGCSAMWMDFAKKLCEVCQYPGLIYDRMGYGKSSFLTHERTIDYLHEYARDELPKIIDSTIPGRPYILIGHSDGGSISLLFGAQKPLLLKSVVTMAAHVFVEPVTLEGIKIATKAFDQGKLSGLFKYHGEKTTSIFNAWSETWLSPEFKYWNIEKDIHPIDSPLLVIQGIDDQYGTQKQVDSICSNVSGNAQAHMIKDCGHSPHSEQPEHVINIISAFITTLSDSTKTRYKFRA